MFLQQCPALRHSWSCLQPDNQTSKPPATSARSSWCIMLCWHSLVPVRQGVRRGQRPALWDPQKLYKTWFHRKKFGCKQSSWPLWINPLIFDSNTQLYIFLYLRTLYLPKRQSSLAARTLLPYVKNASLSSYFEWGPSKDLKLNLLGCSHSTLSCMHAGIYAPGFWAVVNASSSWFAPLAQPQSGAAPPQWRSLQPHRGSLSWSSQLCLEQSTRSLLTMQQCQLTDGSAHAWWQDYKHLLVKRLITVVSHGDTLRK